jgi:hypothetical protein
MSVTFAPEFVAETLYTISCSCGKTVSPIIFPSHGAAYKAAMLEKTVPVPVCDDEFCNIYPVSLITVNDIAEVNMSNVNAVALLNVLGFTDVEDLTGSINAEDFLGRVLMASAVNPSDAGLPTVTEGMVTFCGREEGYIDNRLSELRVVADYAIERNLKVVWS